MNIFLSILLLSYSASATQNSSLALNGDNRNFFQTLNDIFLTSVNNIFTLLKLNKNFTSENKNWLLLHMHATLKDISKRNYEVYEINSRSSSLHTNVEPMDGLINLEKLIEVIVDEQLRPDNTTLNSIQTNITGIKLQLTPLKIPENWENTLKIIKQYLNVLEKSIVDDNHNSHFKNIKDRYKKNKGKVKRWRNLKSWIPPISTMINGNITRRLYHGKNALIEDFPFLASVHVMGKFVCGGSIISRDLVITAASCMHIVLFNKNLLRDSPNSVRVRVGSSYTHQFGTYCNVIKAIFHPKYEPDTLNNNLVILKIKKGLNFTKKNNKLRRVNYRNVRKRPTGRFRELMVLGWGDKDSQTLGAHDALTFSYLDIYDHASCIDTYSSKFVYENNLCAGFIRRGSGACQRDVGGPGVKGSILVGVVSFGPPVCGTPDAPTVFTDVRHYTDWIDSVILREKPKADSTKQHLRNEVEAPTSEGPERPLKSRFSVIRNTPEEAQVPQVNSTDQNLREPILIPRSQYPKAIKVLQFLFNSILGNGKNIDDILYEADDKDESDEGVGFDYKEYDEPRPNVGKQEETVQTPKEEANKAFFEQGLRSVVSGFQNLANASRHIKSITGGEDPFFQAMRNLGNFLGIDKFIKVDVINPITEKILSPEAKDDTQYDATAGEFKYNQNAFGELDHTKTTLNIEIERDKEHEFDAYRITKLENINKINNKPTYMPKHKPVTIGRDSSSEMPITQLFEHDRVTRMLEKTTIKADRRENTYELTTQNLRERANRFLSKNFIRDDKIEISAADVAEKELVELIVLRLKQSTTTIPSLPHKIRAHESPKHQVQHVHFTSNSPKTVNPDRNVVKALMINKDQNSQREFLADSIRKGIFGPQILHSFSREPIFTTVTHKHIAPPSFKLPYDQNTIATNSKAATTKEYIILHDTKTSWDSPTTRKDSTSANNRLEPPNSVTIAAYDLENEDIEIESARRVLDYINI